MARKVGGACEVVQPARTVVACGRFLATTADRIPEPAAAPGADPVRDEASEWWQKMSDERDDAAARDVKAELRRVADTILDLEACGRLLGEAPRLLKLLGDARSQLFAWEVRVARAAPEPAPSGRPQALERPESARVVDEAVQREEDAAREWHRGWERGEGDL